MNEILKLTSKIRAMLDLIDSTDNLNDIEMHTYKISELIKIIDNHSKQEINLADFIHRSWSYWVRYFIDTFHDKETYKNAFTAFTVSKDTMKKWVRLMNTDYKDLSQFGQQSASNMAKRILEDINKNPVLKNEDEPTDCPLCDTTMYFDEITGWHQCSQCGFSLHHCGSICTGYTCGDE